MPSASSLLVGPTAIGEAGGASVGADLASPFCPPEGAGACTDDLREAWAWTEELPVPELAKAARGLAQDGGGASKPPPDALPGYSSLPESTQRVAWRAWMMRAALDQAQHPLAPQGTLLGAAAPVDAGSSAPPKGLSAELAQPRGLRSLWSLETHGYPWAVLSAGKEGETFLVASKSVTKFAAPGAAPLWTAKPEAYVDDAAAADADGDGTLDVVLGITNFFFLEDSPSIVVLDGKTGGVLFTGLSGEDALWLWTLTDVNKDGRPDLLGLDASGRLAAYELDGKKIYQKTLPELPSTAAGYLLVYLILWYFDFGFDFPDVDGDGVKDVAVASTYWAIVYAVVFFDYYNVNLVATYRGTDGAELWKFVPDESPGFNLYVPFASGDLSGDRKEEVLLYQFGFAIFLYVFPVPAFILIFPDSVTGLDGANGVPLFRDRANYVCAFSVASYCAPVGSIDYYPIDVMDLNHDRVGEMVTLERNGDHSYDVVGRVPLAPAGGPSKEIYRHPLNLPKYDDFYGSALARDVDGDGYDELLLVVFGLYADQDETITGLETRVYTVGSQGVRYVLTPNLLGLYEFDPVRRQAYGWTVENDRWVPLDAEGRPTGEGMRLIVAGYPLFHQDINDDKIPDFLTYRSRGLTWIDGSTGRILRDVLRPSNRLPWDFFEQEERGYFVEYELGSGAYILSTVDSPADLWRLGKEPREGYYVSDYPNLNADGLPDVALRTSWSSDSNKREVTVLDVRKGVSIWNMDLKDHRVSFKDVLTSRRGQEIVIFTYATGQNKDTLALHVPEQTADLWSHELPENYDDWFWLGQEDHLVYLEHDEDQDVVHILSGPTGSENRTYALPKDSWLESADLLSVDSDAAPELVLQIETFTPGADADQHQIVAYDWVTNKAIGSFRLSDDLLIEDDSYYRTISSWIQIDVGDWDGDGIVDFAYLEQGVPTVRSTASGKILSVFPETGYVALAVDLDGDGIQEAAVSSFAGRLRTFSYDANAAGIEPGGLIKVVLPGTPNDRPLDNLANAGEKGLPGPGPMLLMALLALAAFAYRARRPSGPDKNR